MKYLALLCLALFILACADRYAWREKAEKDTSTACLKCCEPAPDQLDCALKYKKKLRKLDLVQPVSARLHCDAWLKSYLAPKLVK